jgi:hypothetical protein
MKLLRLALLTSAALLLIFAATPASQAAQRCVLCEDFTNASCPPCASLNPGLRAMLHAMGEDTVVAVAFHVWWPGVDPMYNLNTPEVQARANYYGVPSQGVPHVRVDGSWSTTGYSGNTVTLIRNAIRSRYPITSPCTLDYVAVATGETTVHVIGSVNAEEDLTGNNIRLFVALISDTQQYVSPPGSNGETLFPHVFRDMWPNGTGQSFTVNAGGSYDFDCLLNRDASWDIDNLTVLVWVQDYSSHEIKQAARASVTQNYGMITETSEPRQRMLDPQGGEVQYFIDLTNIGMLADTYSVALEGDFPTGWTHSIEASGVPSDPDLIQVPVESQEQTTLIVRLNPNNVGGSVSFTVHVTTPNEPLLSATETFRAMGGLDVLLVDDDEGAVMEPWYEDALDSAQTNYIIGRWDVSMDPLDATYFDGVDLVIWFTGSGWQDGTTLTAADQTMLANYLDAGGKLFLSGQGIGFDCRTDDFYHNYLHAAYRVNYSAGHNIWGFEGDPISDGLTFSIVGGDGANNQTRQSSQDPADQYAQPLFDWEVGPSQGGFPALRIATDTYKVVYLGFGFEAIDNAADRDALMANAIDWLLNTNSAHNPNNLVPGEFSLGQNYPNPFNPETTIPYMLPDRADVTLHVFDVLGREVTTLAQGIQEAGAHHMNWNASSLASGIYFYRLDAAMNGSAQHATRKLMLLK